MASLVPEAGRGNEDSRPISGGWQHAPGGGRSDGSALGTHRGSQHSGEPRFDRLVAPGGYAWWYIDALSDDRRHGIAIIALIGSVFSPYYVWSGRGDPLNHCALNVGLYGPGAKRWAMTERGRGAVHAERDSLAIGPSVVRRSGDRVVIDIDEITVPWPSRLKGQVRLYPEILSQRQFDLDGAGRHVWQAVAPRARVEVELTQPALTWSGSGYFDTNSGTEPLENAFVHWNWSRADIAGGAAVLYHATRRTEPPLSLAVRCDRSGAWQPFEPPGHVELPSTLWRIPRATYAGEGRAQVLRTLEDGPFYARSMLATHLLGEQTTAMHESLSLDRFSTTWVKAMLPFRMPRALF